MFSTHYPGIKDCGVVKDWRKSEHPNSDSLLFVLDRAQSSVSSATLCNALISKYGEDTFDGMREVYGGSDGRSNITVIEAHFLRTTDRQAALFQWLMSPIRVTLQYSGNKECTMKIVPPVPLLASLSVYVLKKLPLGSYQHTLHVIKEQVIKELNGAYSLRYYKKQSKNDFDGTKFFVDIVPGKSISKHFDGSVSIILKDLPDWIAAGDLRISAFGLTYTLSNKDKDQHYLYCDNCQCLDMHSRNDCPFPVKDEL